jgi:hypothetical protein
MKVAGSPASSPGLGSACGKVTVAWTTQNESSHFPIETNSTGQSQIPNTQSIILQRTIDWTPMKTQKWILLAMMHSGGKNLSTLCLGIIAESLPLRDPAVFKYTTQNVLEVTGHIVAHLTVSSSRKDDQRGGPKDIDLFVTLKKLDTDGKEVFFTGTMGDPVPVTKGWLRTSLRKTDPTHYMHRSYLPYRNYYSTDVQPVNERELYQVDVEIWPTNVILEPGQSLVVEVAGHDTQGVGNFSHEHPEDRKIEVFDGTNNIHVGGERSYITLPIIPSAG